MTSLEQELSRMKSFEAIKYTLNDITLHDLQCVDIMKMLASKRSIISYPTGVGKTLMAAAIMRLLWNEDSSRKFIFLGKLDQIIQTPKKLENACGRPVIASFAAAKSVDALFAKGYENYSVLFLTHESLRNERIMNSLFEHREEYCGLFIDEAHELNNIGNASAASILSGMARQFEYCYAMTATPIVTSVKQMTKLANIVDNKRFPNPKTLESAIKRHSFVIEEEPCFFINRTRAEFGSITNYHGIMELVQPLPHQRAECGGNRLFELCKGEGAYPQVEALVRLVKERPDRRGLIYVNQHSVREWILPFLKEAGIRYACINGYTKMAEREKIMYDFNVKKSLDVIITSVTAALDLDCDYVIFYEFTVELKQMIGRAHRGLGDKEMDIIFVVTDDSYEIDYFYNNIFEVSMLIQGILKQDYSELIQIDKELQQYAKV